MKSILSALFLFFFNVSQSQTVVPMSHDGLLRNFIYYKPTTWDASQELPLLIVLHGLTQTAAGIMEITDFNSIAEENNFIVCYPDGNNNAWNANMNVSVSSTDDKGFIEKIAAYFRLNFNTNPQKQYLCGFSNGGFMSHKMACESEDCFAAIATVSGNMSDTVYANCNPRFPTAVFHIHGTADAVVPYIGSPTTGVSVSQTIEKWKGFLNCSNATSSFDFPNINLLDLSTATKTTYTSCNGNSLSYITVNGGGHQWPGISTLVGGVGTINMDFNSPREIWNFLNGKSCPISSISSVTETKFQLSPNPSSDEVFIETEKAVRSISIIDFNGKVIATIQNPSTSFSINQLESGSYFVEIQFEDGNLNRLKLVKT